MNSTVVAFAFYIASKPTKKESETGDVQGGSRRLYRIVDYGIEERQAGDLQRRRPRAAGFSSAIDKTATATAS
jgi:hypothetical protein